LWINNKIQGLHWDERRRDAAALNVKDGVYLDAG
jgi:hypothetical protein